MFRFTEILQKKIPSCSLKKWQVQKREDPCLLVKMNRSLHLVEIDGPVGYLRRPPVELDFVLGKEDGAESGGGGPGAVALGPVHQEVGDLALAGAGHNSNADLNYEGGKISDEL